MRTLAARRAERSRAAVSVACCPLSASLNAEPLPPAHLAQAQVSILDTDQGVAQSMAGMLQAEGFAVRAFACARELMSQPEAALDGCLIADATTPLAWLELRREQIAQRWTLPVILLTPGGDIRSVVRGMKAGASNCLSKPVQRAELLEAVREALAESRAVREQRAAQLRVREMLERLTPREREVLDLALDGLLVKQIAARLGTSEKTIKTHKGRLMRKMEVRSTLGLLQLMIATGMPLRAPFSEPVPGG
ncbi:MAG TPA: LuxR C-terminal-related transcriptional regulator [Steroidobacteraceae bacterium]|nr:LuxR C-terminal-related transcriptional regulator [Steroidobacteraceae bacterium]